MSTNSIQTGILAAAKQFAVHDTWNRQQLEAFQSSELAKLREFAYAHAPFYRTFHKGLLDRPLQELPVLTKAIMMEHFDVIVTDPKIRLSEVQAHVSALADDAQFLERYWVMATSGSTGSPGIFLFAASEWAAVLASFLRKERRCAVLSRDRRSQSEDHTACVPHSHGCLPSPRVADHAGGRRSTCPGERSSRRILTRSAGA